MRCTGCFWHEDRLTFNFLSISALRTSWLLPFDALLSRNKNCSYFVLVVAVTKIENVIAGYGWKQSDTCTCMGDAPCWGEYHTELNMKEEQRIVQLITTLPFSARDCVFGHWAMQRQPECARGRYMKRWKRVRHGPLMSHGHMRRVQQLLKLKLRRETLHIWSWMCSVITPEAWGEHGRLKVELNLLQWPRPPINPIIWHSRGTHLSKSWHYKANCK